MTNLYASDMPNHDHELWDEDWSDDEDDEELDEEEAAQCPECGRSVHIVTDKCPSCGYWLTDNDRRVMWSEMEKPLWLRVTAWAVLAAFLASLLAAGISFF